MEHIFIHVLTPFQSVMRVVELVMGILSETHLKMFIKLNVGFCLRLISLQAFYLGTMTLS